MRNSLHILPASGWVVALLPTFKLMRRLRRRNHEWAEGWIHLYISNVQKDCRSDRGEYRRMKLMK
jgi:hypothetical protein